MKRFGACVGILTVLILLCVCSLLTVRIQCRQFEALAEEVEEAIETGSTTEALERYDTMNARWESFHNVCGLFVNGEKLDPILEILVELPPLIAQEHPEALSSLEKLQGLVEGVYEEEFPSFWHIM